MGNRTFEIKTWKISPQLTLEEYNTGARCRTTKAAESSVREIIPPQLPPGLGTLQPGRMFPVHGGFRDRGAST